MKKGCAIAFVVFVLFIALIGGCAYKMYSEISAEQPAVNAVVVKWVEAYNQDKFDDAYNLCDVLLTSQMTKEAYVDKCKNLKLTTGNIVLGAQQGFNMRSINGDTNVTVSYQCQGDKGQFLLTVILHQSGAWKVLNTNVTQSTR
jgi:hypothetical protein